MELKNMMRKSVEMTKENNKLLHKIIRTNRWARAFRLLYWVVIIGSMFGAYYYIQPLLDGVLEAYGGIVSGIGGLKNLLPN